jgi:hypothetical protein
MTVTLRYIAGCGQRARSADMRTQPVDCIAATGARERMLCSDRNGVVLAGWGGRAAQMCGPLSGLALKLTWPSAHFVKVSWKSGRTGKSVTMGCGPVPLSPNRPWMWGRKFAKEPSVALLRSSWLPLSWARSSSAGQTMKSGTSWMNWRVTKTCTSIWPACGCTNWPLNSQCAATLAFRGQ